MDAKKSARKGMSEVLMLFIIGLALFIIFIAFIFPVIQEKIVQPGYASGCEGASGISGAIKEIFSSIFSSPETNVCS